MVPFSGAWSNSGMGSPTECLTLSSLEFHSAAAACSLSGILEAGNVPQRFFLSATACRGILRRAEKRGKALPERLKAALQAVAVVEAKVVALTEMVGMAVLVEDLKELTIVLVLVQEYLAEFIDNASGIFKNVHECIGTGAKTPKMFAGLDIGRADDYTVLSIINQDGQMVTAHRWRHDEWTRIIDKVAELIKQYNAVTLVEVNNQGDVFYEMLQSRCKNLEL